MSPCSFAGVALVGSVRLTRLHLFALRARRAGVGTGALAGWPGLKPGSPAVLGLQTPPPNSLRAHRALRSDNGGEHVLEARCARGPETLRSSAPLRRARAHPRPPSPQGDPSRCPTSWISSEVRGVGSALHKSASGPVFPILRGRQAALVLQAPTSSCQRVAAGGDFGGGEKHSGWVGGRSPLCEHARRRCLSAAPTGREASSAARPGHEHRSEVGPQADRTRMSPRRPPAGASANHPSGST